MDGYTLSKLSKTTLQNMLQMILKLNSTELSTIGRRGRVAVQLRFSGDAVATRVSHFLTILEQPNTKPAGPRIGIYIQIHDPSRFHQLRQCILNSLQAAGNGTVDVFFTTTQAIDELRYARSRIEASKFPSLRFVVVSHTENRGADIGMFFHQLLLAKELSLEHDLILKLHSKGMKAWRELMIEQLCGSVDLASRIIDRFLKDKEGNIGLIGPSSLTWTRAGPIDHVPFGIGGFGFNELAIFQLQTAWNLLGKAALPPEQSQTIVAGSFYWVRGNIQIWDQVVLRRVPLLLELLGPYKSGCTYDLGCATALGLERAMPTLVAMRSSVATAP